MSDGYYRSKLPAWVLRRIHDRPVSIQEVCDELGLRPAMFNDGIVNDATIVRSASEYAINERVRTDCRRLRLVPALPKRIIRIIDENGDDCLEVEDAIFKACIDLRSARPDR